MRNRNDDPTEILRDDSLRTTRLNLALRTSYDDFLELVTRSGPHRKLWTQTTMWRDERVNTAALKRKPPVPGGLRSLSPKWR